MGEGRRRAARRGCLGAAATCAILAIASPVRAQDEGARPEVFRGAASSLVASVEVDRDALLPIGDVFRFIALDGESVYETDLQTARASLFFPGNGLIQGPNLACGTFGSSFPAEFAPVLEACTRYDYPLSVVADSTTPTKSSAGAVALGAPSDPVSGDAVAAKAHAAPDGASTTAAMEDVRVVGLPAFGAVTLLPLEQLALDPTLFAIGSATSRTTQRIEQGALVVQSEAVLSGIRLIGGLVHIGSLHATSRASDDARGHRTADASVELGDVTVGGVPAQITEDGLVLGTPTGGPLQQQLQAALNQVLQALRVEVTLLDAPHQLDDGQGRAVASTGGVLVEFAIDAQGLAAVPGPLGDIDLNGTYVGSVQLGSTAAAAGAATFAPEPAFEPAPPVDVGGGPVDAGGTFDPGTLEPAPPAEAAAPPAPVDVPEAPDLIRVFTDPFGGRLGLVYLAFAFAGLGLCIAPRLTVAPRLPGARP